MEKILLYVPLLRWYLSHGLKVTTRHKYLKYEPGKPFEWFSKEVSQTRCTDDDNLVLKQLGNTYKLKGNLDYGKRMKDLLKHMGMIFTTNKDKSFRSSFFKDLEEIYDGFKIREWKPRVSITLTYQCGIVIYQLAKLHMLEFYYDFLDKNLDQRDFKFIQMDTDSLYMVILGTSIDEIIRLEL